MKKSPKPEWSFPVQVTDIGNAVAHYKIAADADARDELAERFDLIALDDLHADLTVTRERGGAILHVAGTLWGTATQRCVVTLEPVPTTVTDTFDAYFAEGQDVISFAKARADRQARSGVDHEVEMVGEEDAPDTIVGGAIDLGEVVAQFFSLALPPYPRKDVDGRELGILTEDEVQVVEAAEAATRPSPFAALKDWKDGLKS